MLFLDEPTTGLDPHSRRDLWAYLRQVRAAHATTIFLTTHYLAEAEDADAIWVLAWGQVIERGSPAEIKGRQLGADRPRGAGDTVDRPTLEDAYLALLEAASLRPAGPP